MLNLMKTPTQRVRLRYKHVHFEIPTSFLMAELKLDASWLGQIILKNIFKYRLGGVLNAVIED